MQELPTISTLIIEPLSSAALRPRKSFDACVYLRGLLSVQQRHLSSKMADNPKVRVISSLFFT